MWQMNTVAEITSAIEKLSPPVLADLAAWFEERYLLVCSSAEIFAMYDKEEQTKPKPS
jgi:hypothetical protein